MNTFFKSKLVRFAFILTILTINACKKDEPIVENTIKGGTAATYDAKVVSAWYGHTLDLIRTTGGYTPPVASRTLGYIGITVYEAMLPAMPENKSLVGQLNGLTVVPSPEFGKEYYMPAVANAALASINTKMFPLPEAKKGKFDSIAILRDYFDTDFRKNGISQEILTRSYAYGEAVANAIYIWESTDIIGHEAFRKNFPASYTVPTGAGLWEPTSATQLIPMQPFWGSARCFIPKSTDEAQPSPPPVFTTSVNSDMYNYALQVYNQVKNNTPEQKKIALFWADGGGTITPPGHSIALTRQLIDEKGLKLDKAVEAYAKVGIAITDAFMACWKCKYKYNLMRPVTYIKKNIDPAWASLIGTPPFPEYISGHSSQSGAAAYVLSAIFGSKTAFTDKTHQNRKDIDGTARSFDSFDAMAKEAAISRLYGGIHYEFGNAAGISSGMKVGQALESKVNFKK